MTQKTLSFENNGRGFTDITSAVQKVINEGDENTRLVNVFIKHTSASLLINENADPDVRTDLEAFFARLIKDGDPLFVHTEEGPDDMPSHIRHALTETSLNVPVQNKKMLLGTWQGLYLWEHRFGPHTRKVVVTLI